MGQWVYNSRAELVDSVTGELITDEEREAASSGINQGENITLNDFNLNLGANNNALKGIQQQHQKITRKRPFQNLFSKMKEGWQNRQGGFRNLGSAQYDERAFFNEGQEDEEVNPNYGKLARHPKGHEKYGEIVDKGKGFFFGKEGGFGSNFGTGHGLLSGFFGGGGMSGGLAQAGEDLMEQGAYQHGNFYGAGGVDY